MSWVPRPRPPTAREGGRHRRRPRHPHGRPRRLLWPSDAAPWSALAKREKEREEGGERRMGREKNGARRRGEKKGGERRFSGGSHQGSTIGRLRMRSSPTRRKRACGASRSSNVTSTRGRRMASSHGITWRVRERERERNRGCTRTMVRYIITLRVHVCEREREREREEGERERVTSARHHHDTCIPIPWTCAFSDAILRTSTSDDKIA